MKIVFDTNVYVAEALLGGAAEAMLQVTLRNRWLVFSCRELLDEVERVLTGQFGFSLRFGRMARQRVRRRTVLVLPPASRHTVASDPADSPILQTALAAGADLLITNDQHLLALNPYQSLRILSMTDYYELLVDAGHLKA